MSIVDRVKNICMTPKTEWSVIAAEPATTGGLITSYVVPLSAIGAVAGFIGGSLIGRTLPFVGTYRVSLGAGLVGAAFTVGMAIVSVFVLSLIINALAPTFGGQKDATMALKVAVYSYTPAWVAAVLNILPLLGILAIFGGLYSLYVLYLGLPRLMKCPEDKAVGYTAVIVICAIVLMFIIGAISATIMGVGMMGAGALGGPSARAGEVQYDKNSALGKLQAMSKAIDASSKQMDAAAKSGDTNAEAAAAMSTLGTILGGGQHVDPIAIDQLTTFVPATFAGLPQKSHDAEKTGLASLMVSNSEATYGDDAQKQITLKISDTGGASGLVGLASWVGVQDQKEDENGSEQTTKVGGRLVHIQTSKRPGGTNEFSLVLGDRFVVSASGTGVEEKDLQAAVMGLDLGKLESMKNAGVSK